jgi:hypothetical protein
MELGVIMGRLLLCGGALMGSPAVPGDVLGDHFLQSQLIANFIFHRYYNEFTGQLSSQPLH